METLPEFANDFIEFAKRIKGLTGLDLLLYKPAQVIRRLTTIRDRKGFETFMAFFHEIERNPEIYKVFMDQLTINVTEFYRNPERWNVLGASILPELLSGRRHLKCWSAACSTGEEPYTAVLVASDLLPLPSIEVLATDLDESVISKAKTGIYTSASIKDVPSEKLKKYFRQDGDDYWIHSDVKKRVEFRHHNLLGDVYPTGYDLIICRNVLIYFTEEAKDAIYRKFANSLRPGGYLFVGGIEQIMSPAKYGLTPTEMFFYRKL